MIKDCIGCVTCAELEVSFFLVDWEKKNLLQINKTPIESASNNGDNLGGGEIQIWRRTPRDALNLAGWRAELFP